VRLSRVALVLALVGGDNQAWLNIASGGTTVAHAAIYTMVK
jgi:hypothetical protein